MLPSLSGQANQPEPQRVPNVPNPQNGGIRPEQTNSAIAFLSATEPLWTMLATVFVFVSYLLGLGLQYPWIGVGILFLTVPVRILLRRPVLVGTSFELPLALLLIGGLVGLVTSPNGEISLGVFQCMIALSLFVYSWLTWPNLALLVKWLIRLVPAALLIVLVLALFDLPSPATQPNFQFGGSGTQHGLALALIIVVCILAGIALFGRGSRMRWFASAVAVALLVIVLIVTWDSIKSLFAWNSIRGRIPIWDGTLSLLADAPIAGLGLGCWALSYHGSAAGITEPTHAHNAYLELYVNTGLFGALALVVALVVGARLAWRIIRSPRNHPWYGFGVGVVIACVATLLVGVVESAPIGVPLVAEDTYYYLISPVPWILAGLLVAAKDLPGKEMKE